MQCTARAVAVHCGDGCSALHLRGEKLALKSSVLFWTEEKGGKTHSIWVTEASRKFLLNPRYSKQESPGRTTIAHSGPTSTHPWSVDHRPFKGFWTIIRRLFNGSFYAQTGLNVQSGFPDCKLKLQNHNYHSAMQNMFFNNTMTPGNSKCVTNKIIHLTWCIMPLKRGYHPITEAVNAFLPKHPKAYHERMTCPLTLLPGKWTETDRNILI